MSDQMIFKRHEIKYLLTHSLSPRILLSYEREAYYAKGDHDFRITIPEDLNYGDVFDDLLTQYTTNWELISAKTTNMGSLFKLSYRVTLADTAKEKEFMDALRCRNGNLEISIARQEANMYEL